MFHREPGDSPVPVLDTTPLHILFRGSLEGMALQNFIQYRLQAQSPVTPE